MPFSHLYNLAIKMRRAMYRRGVLASHDLGVPVISVGNITVGGTGKTPLVAYVARVLGENDRKVCVLTRGYKRKEPNKRVVVSDGDCVLSDALHSGDEPYELAQNLQGISAVIADKNRAAAGEWAKEEFGIDAFVLDDGFQHLKVRRTLDLVTIDATNPFGNGRLLPSGILREPMTALSRAHAVILTRTDLAENIENLKNQLKEIAPNIPVFTSCTKTGKVVPLSKLFSSNAQPSDLNGKNILAFCALGNPDGFFGQLKNEGLDIAATEKFPDHHAYTQADVTKLENAARDVKADVLLTTVKDAVKLKGIEFSMPCFVVVSKLVFDDEARLRQFILSAL